MNTSEVLNKAADLIEERGWTTGVEGWPGRTGHSGRLCIEGGIVAALGLGQTPTDYLRRHCPAHIAVRSYLAERVAPEEPLYTFNDAPNRTATEVIEVLRAAALIEAAREQQTTPAVEREGVSAK